MLSACTGRSLTFESVTGEDRLREDNETRPLWAAVCRYDNMTWRFASLSRNRQSIRTAAIFHCVDVMFFAESHLYVLAFSNVLIQIFLLPIGSSPTIPD